MLFVSNTRRFICSYINEKGYLPNNSYVVSIIYVKTENIEIEDNRRESIVSQLSGYIRWNYKNILTSVQDKYISLVLCNYSDIECDEISKNVFNKLCTWLYASATRSL